MEITLYIIRYHYYCLLRRSSKTIQYNKTQ